MKYFKGIVATSHRDTQGDIIAVEGLEGLVNQAQENYIPIGIGHDPRIPPLGRVVSARLARLDDGAYGVEAVGEIFEPGEIIPISGSPRQIPIRSYSTERLQITYDYSYRGPEGQVVIRDIARIFGSEPQEELKKAVDPLSAITIGGTFVLGAIAVGFLNKVSADAWDAVKARLKSLSQQRPESAKENLLVFELAITVGRDQANVHVILTNPTDAEVSSFLSEGLQQLDYLVPAYFDAAPDMRRLVLAYANGMLSVSFGVRKDAVPIWFDER